MKLKEFNQPLFPELTSIIWWDSYKKLRKCMPLKIGVLEIGQTIRWILS